MQNMLTTNNFGANLCDNKTFSDKKQQQNLGQNVFRKKN